MLEGFVLIHQVEIDKIRHSQILCRMNGNHWTRSSLNELIMIEKSLISDKESFSNLKISFQASDHTCTYRSFEASSGHRGLRSTLV